MLCEFQTIFIILFSSHVNFISVLTGASILLTKPEINFSKFCALEICSVESEFPTINTIKTLVWILKKMIEFILIDLTYRCINSFQPWGQNLSGLIKFTIVTTTLKGNSSDNFTKVNKCFSFLLFFHMYIFQDLRHMFQSWWVSADCYRGK